MTISNKGLKLSSLRNDSFFQALRNGDFCLVLGAGFSYGLKNKSQSDYNDEKFIPIVKDFISLTRRKFKTSIADGDYNNAADKWQRKINSKKVDFSEFKNLFLLDEEEFNLKNKKLYANILEPDWSRIYTFNFDNVLNVLIDKDIENYEIQYHYVGSFSSAKKIGIGYLHNSILNAKGIKDIVFTNAQYAEKIFTKDNHLYFSLLNDIENHGKNLLIIGCGFVEQSVYTYLHNRISRNDLKIIHINFKDKPNYGFDFEKKVKDISWINCTTEEFLNFLSDNIENVSKDDGLPKFLELLKEEKEVIDGETLQVQSFNDFLKSQFLTYFSRASFKEKLPEGIQKDFLSEHDLLRFITEEGFNGLIIHGQGGIGKTRLLFELGKLLLNEYIVIKVLPDFNHLDALIAYLNKRPNKKYILLFDYIEVQNVFDEIINWIRGNTSINIKIIGNCRNTFVPDLKSKFLEFFKFIDIGFKNKIGLEKELERDYKREVILSIINSISDKKLSENLKQDYLLRTFYQARPSFAAFIKHIHLKNPNTDLRIKLNETFSNWLIRKLKLSLVGKITYPNFFESKRYIFQILSCLPANPSSAHNLEKEPVGDVLLADEINKLIKDGWIDRTEKALEVVHDTVNDTLLFEYFKHFHFNDFYVTIFLEFALKTKNMSSMMWSIQRICEYFPSDVTPSIQKSIAQFIDDHLDETMAQENWFRYKLDNTHLISEKDRIDLFVKHRDLFKENFAHEKIGSSLAFSMEWVHENISNEALRKRYSEDLYDLFFNEWNIDGRFNDFVLDARGGKIISSYINLFGIDDYINYRFNEYIGLVECNVNNLEFISLAIVSWFNQNGETNKKIEKLISLWFVVYENEQPEDVNPQYLIDCCLAKKIVGTINYKLIEPNIYNLKSTSNYFMIALKVESILSCELKTSVTKWFNIYEKEKPETINPTTLALAWLEKGDDSSIIRNIIEQIILHPYKSIEIKAKCIGLWLEKNNETELVEPFIEEVLDEDIYYKTAYYIIGYWLQKSEKPLIVKPFLSKWLNDFSEPQMQSFIFQSWLTKGDDPNIVIKPIKKWVQDTTNMNSIGNVFSQFLIMNGNIPELKSEITEWLSNNTDDNQSISVLGHLLEKTNDETLIGELEIIAAKVFKNFATQREIGFSIGYWIERGGKLSIVEPYINEWLKIFGNSKQAMAIIGLWLEKGGQVDKVKEFIVPYLQGGSREKELSKLLFSWIYHGGEVSLIADFIQPFFEVKENQEFYEARYLICSWLEKTNLPLLVKDAIKPWLAANYTEAEGSIRVCSFWLDKGDDISLVEDYIKNHFFEHAEIKDSNQIFENWIEKGGDKSIIEESLKKYLRKETKDLNTTYVVIKWLNHNGSFRTLEEYINNKFINYFFHKNCLSVFNYWLKNQGDLDMIKPLIIKYLAFNYKETNAIRLIELCVNYNTFFEELETFVFEIIELKGFNPFTKILEVTGNKISIRKISDVESEFAKIDNEPRQLSYKFKSFLKSGQSPELIKTDVEEFLLKNGNENFASHVISAWIEHGNDFEMIKDFLISWLDHNLRDHCHSSFVIASALEDKNGFDVVHDKAMEWLSLFGQSYNAKFPLSAWLKLKGNEGAFEIKNWIVYWVENLYNPAKHNWRDDLLLDYCKNKISDE